MTSKPIASLVCALCLCVFLAGLCAAPAAASLDAHLVIPAPFLVVTAGERDAGDLLLLTALAAFFGADVHVVVPLYPAWSIHDIVLILALHHDSHRDIGYIIGLRHRHGWGWGEIAHRLGVHPGAFNQQRVWAKKQDRAVGEGLLVRAMAGHWGVPERDVRAMRARSYPARDIALAANIAAQSGKPLGDVLKARASKQSWKQVAGRFGMDSSQLARPAKAKGRSGPPAKAQPAPGKAAGQSPAAAKGKGAAPAKAQAPGPAKPKGKPAQAPGGKGKRKGPK